MCMKWKDGNCTEAHCGLRHMELKVCNLYWNLLCVCSTVSHIKLLLINLLRKREKKSHATGKSSQEVVARLIAHLSTNQKQHKVKFLTLQKTLIKNQKHRCQTGKMVINRCFFQFTLMRFYGLCVWLFIICVLCHYFKKKLLYLSKKNNSEQEIKLILFPLALCVKLKWKVLQVWSPQLRHQQLKHPGAWAKVQLKATAHLQLLLNQL